jgi:hypothetical protein
VDASSGLSLGGHDLDFQTWKRRRPMVEENFVHSWENGCHPSDTVLLDIGVHVYICRGQMERSCLGKYFLKKKCAALIFCLLLHCSFIII